MTYTLLRNGEAIHAPDAWSRTAVINLNIASIAISGLLFVLAVWCRCYISKAHPDGLRCRTMIALSVSTVSYSVSQLSLYALPAGTPNSSSVRVLVFVSTVSLVMNSLLVACAIGADATVRYGLRSFVLAHRLSSYYEAASLLVAVAVSQPVAYMFDGFRWTGNAVTVSSGPRVFNATVWMVESVWIMSSIVIAWLSMAFALIKLGKMTRHSASRSGSFESIESVFGSAASIRGRIYIAACYVIAMSALLVWKPAFRFSGSQSAWLLRASAICEPLQTTVLLPVFLVDIILILSRRLAWLQSTNTMCATGGISSSTTLPAPATSGTTITSVACSKSLTSSSKRDTADIRRKSGTGISLTSSCILEESKC